MTNMQRVRLSKSCSAVAIRGLSLATILYVLLASEAQAGSPICTEFHDGALSCNSAGCFVQPFPHYEYDVAECDHPNGWFDWGTQWVDPEDVDDFEDGCYWLDGEPQGNR